MTTYAIEVLRHRIVCEKTTVILEREEGNKMHIEELIQYIDSQIVNKPVIWEPTECCKSEELHSVGNIKIITKS
jgi:hypothetical protein